MAQSYPVNPDTSFESFLLNDENAQKLAFGKIYSLSNLVPMNYTKIALDCASGVLTYAPVREQINMLNFFTDFSRINDENTFNYQSITLKDLLKKCIDYYKVDVLGVPAFSCPLGVVTELKQYANSSYDHNLGSGVAQIYWIAKINWFVIPGSLYS